MNEKMNKQTDRNKNKEERTEKEVRPFLRGANHFSAQGSKGLLPGRVRGPRVGSNVHPSSSRMRRWEREGPSEGTARILRVLAM